MKLLVNILDSLVRNRFSSLTVLGIVLLDGVDARRCTFATESGQIKEFYCNAYEFCCGSLCCRARSLGFFQLWYFWLLIMLMLLLCSGGGWWVRYRRRYQMGMPPFGMPTNTPSARVYSGGGFQQTRQQHHQQQPMQQPPPPPYGAGYPTAYPPNGSYPNTTSGYPPGGGAVVQLPPLQPQAMRPQFNEQNYYNPAPAYMGPPPSYDVATAKPS